MNTSGPTHRNTTVLYVEDSASNIVLMEMYFERFDGVDLLIATTGEQGVEMARTHRPDIILMDINLPGISGIEALMLLRQCAECKGTPIIAVSADAMPENIKKGKQSGFDDYLTKPINLDTLRSAIDKYSAA